MIFAASTIQSPNWLPTIAALIALILGGGGITALVKVRPEKSAILIDSATDVVVVQKGLITDLRAQNERTEDKLSATNLQLERAQEQIRELQQNVAAMSSLRLENDRLKARVTAQDLEIKQLRARVDELEHPSQVS